MTFFRSLRRRWLVLSIGLAALPTWADDDCRAPLDRWQTREAVRQLAAAQGWQIQRLKIDDGCYEIRGVDAQGHAFKAKIDPETLKVLKMKQEDRHRARERERSDDPAASQSRPAPLPSPSPASRGQTE